MNSKEKAVDLGKHIFRLEHAKAEDVFFEGYDKISDEDFKARHLGIVGSKEVQQPSHATLRRIWKKFVMEERRDYILRQTTVSMDDIMRIGIDKFVVANGWESAKDVSSWRSNSVRMGICSECKDQFLPLMFQFNHGLCKGCRPAYDVTAMQNYLTKVLATNERYVGAMDDAMMDFYIMFYVDEMFRNLFKKENPFAQTMRETVVETPKWLDEEMERRELIMQQKLLEMVPDDK